MAATDNFEDVAAGRASLGRALGRLFQIFMRPEMAKWRPLLLIALLATVAAKGLSVAAPIFLGDGVNALIDAEGTTSQVIWAFAFMLLAYAGARFAASAVPFARDALFAPVMQDANRLIATGAFEHAQKLHLQFHLTRRAGALNRVIERGANGMDYLMRFLAFNIGPTIIELILAAIVLAARYGWGLSVAAVVTVATYAVFTVVITEWRARQRRVLNEADTELRARALDSLANFETVKAFAAEDREATRYDDGQKAYNAVALKLQRSLAGLNIGQEFIMSSGLLAAALLAGIGVARGRLEAGDVTAVILILVNIYRPLNILGWAWREIRQGIVDMEKLFGLTDVPPAVADRPGAPPLRVTGGAMRFESVGFTHEGRTGGLRGLSLDIPAGAFVGVVGPSGAGKSTLLKLVFRFYDPHEGRVLIDGQDIAEVTQTSLRGCLGLVPQEVVLFNDTLRYNLAYARPHADDAAIRAAAEQAQLGPFLKGLPEGLDTRVGERGLKLSGGEKQRVGLARALLKDPAILVLDEATSSLDSETEREVQTALLAAAKGRTTIAVAHRLSTIAGADMIVVLEDGRIVEQGPHAALLSQGGRYAEMWARQAAGEGDPKLEPA